MAKRSRSAVEAISKEIATGELEMAKHRRSPFMVHLTIEEKSLIAAKANIERKSISAYIREAALKRAETDR